MNGGWENIEDVLKDILLIGVLISIVAAGGFFILKKYKVHLAARASVEAELMRQRLVRVDVPLHEDWKLERLEDGQRVAMSEIRGKVLFINIWATWCPGCVWEMSTIENLWKHFKDQKDIAFLIISSEDSSVVWKFVHKHSYRVPVYIALEPRPQIFEAPVSL